MKYRAREKIYVKFITPVASSFLNRFSFIPSNFLFNSHPRCSFDFRDETNGTELEIVLVSAILLLSSAQINRRWPRNGREARERELLPCPGFLSLDDNRFHHGWIERVPSRDKSRDEQGGRRGREFRRW